MKSKYQIWINIFVVGVLSLFFIVPNVQAQTTVNWPCDPTLTEDMSCAPNSLLMSCLSENNNRIFREPYDVVDSCYGRYDRNELDQAGLVANDIQRAVQEGVTDSNLPCTRDANTCAQLYYCIHSSDNVNRPAAVLACYNVYAPNDYTAAEQEVQQEIEDNVTNPSNPSRPPATRAGQLEYNPLEPLPGLENVANLEFPEFLAAVFNILLTIGALVAVVTLVIGGVSYMTSEAYETKGEARKRINAAFFGLLLLIGAWLILWTINPELLNFSFMVNDSIPQETGNITGDINGGVTGGISLPNSTQLQQQLNACIARNGINCGALLQ